ncbi:tetratricopeptide repeat protein [Halomicronema sp. CCY15110]|uniref:tetratricopeptide repeat protein n=1 Tax=Halomicronema sp. CCY15110 TaxID=2767773 RepID=UPI001951FC9C|nr:hypothetical protein [Halomicronema sp. CCY15110]
MVTAVSVLPLNSQVLPGHNQETYQRLQAAVQAIPPHQIWLATCDDLPLQRQLAATLAESLHHRRQMAAPQRLFDIEQPNLVQQIQGWLPLTLADRPPVLQVLGIEQLTHCGPDTQYQFLRSLHQLWPIWQQLDVSLLLWLPRPWLKQIRREVPHLGRSVFEFIGEPTPISTIAHQPHFQVAFSAVRDWQFWSPPAAEELADAPAPTEASLETPSVPINEPPEATSPEDAAADAPLPTVSASLWHQLQDDLTDFESSPRPPRPSLGEDATSTTDTAAAPAAAPESSPAATTLDQPAETAERSPQTIAKVPVPTETEAAGFQSVPSAFVPPPGDRSPSADWAIALELRDRVQTGDHSTTTLERALQAYESLQPEHPATPQRTEALNDLGSLYWLWAQQATTGEVYCQRLTHSCELYEAALVHISPHTAPGVLNRLHSNLGSVYSLLAVHQQPGQYLGKAVRAFHRALQYAPVESMPEEYVTLQTHLGTAYWSLAQQTQESTHLHRAIAAYQEALQHSQPQPAPQLYAQLQNNLGIALWSLARHERPVFLLEQAIGAYRTALAYRTVAADPAGYAATQNNLGTAYWDLGGHCEAQSTAQQQAWRQAILAYEAAIAATEPLAESPLSFDVWAAHHSVGVVYDQLAIALAPNITAQAPLLTQATHHYVAALTGWQSLASASAETALQALVRNLQLQARFLGIEQQQRSLSQIPADWLPEIWRKL